MRGIPAGGRGDACRSFLCEKKSKELREGQESMSMRRKWVVFTRRSEMFRSLLRGKIVSFLR